MATLLRCIPAALELGSFNSQRHSASRTCAHRMLQTRVAAAEAEAAAAVGEIFFTNAGSILQNAIENEPENALSLPTWTIHVASVVEWVVAMSLVWQYGDTKNNSTWKGLTWAMVPLLGGALCACTWHFFYNAESLEILVVLQSALTLIGNITLWMASFRIYQAVQSNSNLSP